MKKKRSFMWLCSILSISALLFVAACGQVETSEPEEDLETGGEQAGAVSLDTSLDVKQEGNKILFDLHVTNTGDEDIELEFPSSQMYEVTVTDSNGKEVYRYSINKMFAQAITTVDIGAGKTHSWSDELDLAAQGVELDGTVTIKAEVLASSETNGFELDNSELTASTTLEIKALDVDEEVYENDAFRHIKVEGENGVYTITGEARVFEATVSYSVTEGHFYYVEDFVTASSGAPDWGAFTIELDLSKEELPENGTITLELYEESAKDGSRLHELIIPLETFN